MKDDIHSLAEEFAGRIPEAMFSLAQIQGFLLTKKTDPKGSVTEAETWVAKQIAEKRRIEELKEKKLQKRREAAEKARKVAEESRERDESKDARPTRAKGRRRDTTDRDSTDNDL